MSAGDLNYLSTLWDAYQRRHSHGMDDPGAPFAGAKGLYDSIDSIPYGDIAWEGFKVQYQGEITANSPTWMSKTYDVWYRNPLDVMEAQIGNPEFSQHLDYAPKQLRAKDGTRQYIDLMSGEWAWSQCVRRLHRHVAFFSPFGYFSCRTPLPETPIFMVRCLHQLY